MLCKHQVIGSIPIGSTIFQRFQVDEDTRSRVRAGQAETADFDIVNGFLKSMPWRYRFDSDGLGRGDRIVIITISDACFGGCPNLAEI